jgi:hypothetical protein
MFILCSFVEYLEGVNPKIPIFPVQVIKPYKISFWLLKCKIGAVLGFIFQNKVICSSLIFLTRKRDSAKTPER